MAKDPEKLLEHMRRNRHGRRLAELEELYRAFNFEKTEGAKHLLYFHPVYKDIAGTITRSSGELDAGYIKSAVERIDLLKSRLAATEKEKEHKDGD